MRPRNYRFCCFGTDQHGLALLIKGTAHFGRADLARRTFQQAHFKSLFQSGNALAEGSLGHADVAGRRRKTLVSHYSMKVEEVVEVDRKSTRLNSSHVR